MSERSLNRWIPITGTVLAILGVADSIYLTISHYTTTAILACPESSFVNCAKVTTSPYSLLFGIPVALLGLGYFIVMVYLQSPWAWRSANKLIFWLRLVFAIGGIGMIGWLLFAEFYRLHSICLYCTAVHAITFLVFVVTVIGSSLVTTPTTNVNNEA